MLKTFEINGKPRHTIENLNFSVQGVPYLITETENPDNEPAFVVVKNLNSGNKAIMLHKRLIELLLAEHKQ